MLTSINQGPTQFTSCEKKVTFNLENQASDQKENFYSSTQLPLSQNSHIGQANNKARNLTHINSRPKTISDSRSETIGYRMQKTINEIQFQLEETFGITSAYFLEQILGNGERDDFLMTDRLGLDDKIKEKLGFSLIGKFFSAILRLIMGITDLGFLILSRVLNVAIKLSLIAIGHVAYPFIYAGVYIATKCRQESFTPPESSLRFMDKHIRDFINKQKYQL